MLWSLGELNCLSLQSTKKTPDNRVFFQEIRPPRRTD